MGKNQKGFTLVELLIAIAIMSIVLAAVCGFIIVGSKSYANANSDITVQQESQLALNQMSDVLIDTTRSVNYVGYDSGGTPSFALKDSEFTSAPEDKALIMYNGESTIKPDGTVEMGEGNGNKNYQFLWDRSEETLYYSEIPVTESSFPSVGEAGCVVLAEHVTDFAADLSQVEEKRVVQLTLTFEMGGKTYTTANNVTIRNKVLINDAEIEPLDKSVTLAVTPKKASVILEPGEQYHFSTPKVSGTNVLDKSVKWSIEGSGSGDPMEGGSTADGSAFIDTDNGIIQISSSEKAAQFNVVITTNAKDSDGNRATATVIVIVKRANSVSVSYGTASTTPLDELAAGSEFTMTANVSGNKLGEACDGTGCTWDISKDHDIAGWTVLQGPVELVSGGAKEASFKVKADAQSGDKIAIMATSAISRGIYNNYDESVRSEIESKFGYHFTSSNVVGYYEFEVSDYIPGNIIPLSGDFVYGTDNKQLFDYMYNGLSTELQNGRRVVFVRVREGSINADKSNDRIAAYYSTGANVRFFPDQFGLDINKSYYVMMQIIDPMPAEIRDKNANDRLPGEYQDASDDEIRAELLNEANFDRSGRYIGTKFHSGDMYYGTLNPPNIIVTYDGKSFPNNNGDYISYSIAGGSDTIMNKFGVSDIVNIFDEIRDDRDRMQFTIYQGTSADSATWERIYGVDLSSGAPVLINGSTVEKPNNLAYSGENPFAKGWISVYPQGQSNTIKMNSNSSVSQSKLDACGTYYIVPGFAYANNPHVRDYEYIIEPTGEMDFELHYYEQKYAAIPLKITSGLTLKIIDPNQICGINGTEGWINFPLPSSGDSLFTTTGVTRIKADSYNVYRDDFTQQATISNLVAECKYVQAAGLYEVTLYKVMINEGIQSRHIYGVYTCSPSGEEWNYISGPVIEQDISFETTLTLNDSVDEIYGSIEFPLPSSGDELFNGNGTAKVEEGLSFILYNTQSTDIIGSFTTDAECTYSGSSDTVKYTLKLYSKSVVGNAEVTHIYGVWTCAEKGTEWVRAKGASETVNTTLELADSIKGINGSIVFPLPSSGDNLFTSGGAEGITFNLYDYDSKGAVVVSGNTFKTDARCSYNSGAGEYELTLYSMSGKYMDEMTHIYGIYKCKANGTEWTRKEGPSDSTAVRVNTSEFKTYDSENKLASYKTYLYAPDDPLFSADIWNGSGFGLTPKKDGEVSISLPVKKTSSSEIEKIGYKMSYSYDSSSDKHTLVLSRVTCYYPYEEEYISFHWDASGNTWVLDSRTTKNGS